MNVISTITVGQNVRMLKEAKVVTDGVTFVYEGRNLRFMLLRVEALDQIEGVLTDDEENVVYVFEKALAAPTYGYGNRSERVPVAKVDYRYIYQNMFSDEIGRAFFRKHATNLEMLKAIYTNDVVKIGEIDEVYLAILTYGRMVRNEYSDNRSSELRQKLYPSRVISSVEANVRVNINGENRHCKRTLSIYFHGVDMSETIPPILAEYEFHSPVRAIKKTSAPVSLSLKRRYRNGLWPNAKTFVEHPLNKPYLDLFFAEKAEDLDD
jgi:hypothetical protein